MKKRLNRCDHMFWKDRNPPNCFNCGKTEIELWQEKIIQTRQEVLDEAIEKIKEGSDTSKLNKLDWRNYENKIMFKTGINLALSILQELKKK